MKAFLRAQVRRLSCVVWPRTLVLAYHHVREPGRTTPGVTTPPADFAAHMHYLARHRLAISMEQLLTDLRRGRPTGGRVVVTLDDAPTDTWEIAYPILKDAGVPATVFVPTGMMGVRKTPWWNRLFLLSEAARAKGVDLGPYFSPRNGETPRTDAPLDRWDAVRWLEESRRDEAIARAAAELKVEGLAEGPTPMDWDQVADLDRSGLITLGAHTISHPVMPGLSDAALAAEVVGSRDALAKFTSFRPVFAYPYGDPGAIDGRVIRAVRDAGFEAAFTCDLKPVTGAEDCMALGRVVVDDGGLDEFRWLVDHYLRR